MSANREYKAATILEEYNALSKAYRQLQQDNRDGKAHDSFTDRTLKTYGNELLRLRLQYAKLTGETLS